MPEIEEYVPLKAQMSLHSLIRGKNCAPFHNGVQEILLSGSVGSSKSEGLAHELIVYAIENPGCHIGLGRKSMPQLRDTLLKGIVDHFGVNIKYDFNKTRGIIDLPNGSRMTCISWADGLYKKVRSYEFEVFAIEEGTENPEIEFYTEIFQRIGRRSKFKKQFMITATNPDSPAHWLYKRIITSNNPNRHVIYSLTKDNIHLPKGYIETLREGLSPKECLRQLEGQWIELSQDVIYYNYTRERNYIDKPYEYNHKYPISISFDFNIGVGKPMSCVAGQRIGKIFNFGHEAVVEGSRTEDICQEIASTIHEDLLQADTLEIYGDAAGKHKDTRNNKTDYDIIRRFFEMNYPNLLVKILLPSKNPPIRNRHNKTNAQFLNDLDQINCYVFNGAPTLDEGFRLSGFKKGATLIEDDSKPYQHITTSASYKMHYIVEREERQKSRRLM